MRIMITDSTEAAGAVADALRAEGHDVRQECLAGDLGGPSCAGMDVGTCSLDEHVDVAIAGLGRHTECASAGVVCARRHGVPVVTVGLHDADHHDLEPALRRAATSVDPEVRRLVMTELTRLTEGMDPPPQATIRREPGRFVIETVVDESMSAKEARVLGVRLHDAVSSRRRWLPALDVVVRHQRG